MSNPMRLFNVIALLMLCSMSWAQQWKVEAEDGASSVKWKDGVADIHATKGLTLWCRDLMQGNTVIEYEAQIAGDGRVSDLNAFWMAERPGGCGGRFLDNYAMQMYYLGYGGNDNTTTRFRRYTGDKRGVTDDSFRPIILKEYRDREHLLTADHWYQIRIEVIDGHTRFIIDGQEILDYVDPTPLTRGYFGFRTTTSHARLRNFRYQCTNPDQDGVRVQWVGGKGSGPVTFGVPYAHGEMKGGVFELTTQDGKVIPADNWTMARWADGSIKWQAFSAVVPQGYDHLWVKHHKSSVQKRTSRAVQPSVQDIPFYVTLNGKRQEIQHSQIEYQGDIRTVRKYSGKNFVVRTYTYQGSNQIRLVHTLLVDSALNAQGLNELSLHFPVAMQGPGYERYVRFDDHQMSVQPLIARRKIDIQRMDSVTRLMLANIAQWDGFRLSQLSPNGYSIRKRAIPQASWIGTIEGTRSRGQVTVGDSTRATMFCLKDFWQSFPSTLQVDGARQDTAWVTVSLHSPEAEPFSFAPYDTIAHHLEAAYEDVQPGMSTANGMARTSEIYIMTAQAGEELQQEMGAQLVCTPEYYHRKRTFGIWSLPTVRNERDAQIEKTLDDIRKFYLREIERNSWYGFWNYGDVMHAYDSSRDEWRYDVGGYAWDNTELGSPAMMWYMFLRSGDPDWWRMATAMTRHCSEVDVYHSGPHAGLGSRHNVLHWGCGAKESRISEAWWNRFMYYLTADERLGDLMDEVVDSDTLLYHLDPMRLAQPRNMFPCTAPARLRIGPDWLGYASNWFTAYERRNSQRHLQKIFTGMQCIGQFPNGFFRGPLALGYYPETGVITSECDTTLQCTNHLMAIMGGFELMHELEFNFAGDQTLQPFFRQWQIHARDYKRKAKEITRNSFLVPRLSAFAGWRLGDTQKAQEAWQDMLKQTPYLPGISQPVRQGWSGSITNDNATWTLDAIFIKEVLR